ncbi:MAG: hypothetical protein ACI9KA_002128 [Parasphingorhabdus sp.]|jgi:hypothetical protein|uniref:hypothetical protein n=1 Tax=Parasphingorhabdus sp. TaxID=2709688 RepID=UPI0039E59974
MSDTQKFASEQIDIGEQMLIHGVQPITLAERLMMLANAPMQPRSKQRPADDGLFDTNAINQLEMFHPLPSRDG